MNLYLILIGLISAVSCALIIICINKPPLTTSLPSDGSKSPLKPQGLTQTQKSHLLIIVCVIFFLSMVTTNIKSSKFTVMFNSLMSLTEKNPTSKVIDLRQVFYGSKGNCEFTVNKHQYPVLFEYLHEGKMEQKFLDKLTLKNFDKQLFEREETSSNENENYGQSSSQLIILSSNRPNLGAQITLPWMSSKLCKSEQHQIPLIYLNLSSSISPQGKFESLFNLDRYELLKQSMCRLNGIEITKEIQKIEDYYVERETFSKSDTKKKSQRENAYLVIDNFQFLNELLIFNKNVFLLQNGNFENTKKSKQKQSNVLPQSLGPQYQLFIDKLLTDLIPNCKINAILHTNDHQKVSKLYQYWKMFHQHSTFSSSYIGQSLNLDSFPFQVKHWQGLNKIEFYEVLKSIISESSRIKGKEDIVWKIFEKSFGKVSISSRKVISNEKEQTVKVENNEEILFSQMEHFFVKLAQELSRDSSKQTSIKIKETKIGDIRQKIAEYYGLGSAYQSVKSLTVQEKGVSIGTLLRKTTIDNIKKLQKLQLLYIKQGKVFLVN